MNARKKFSPVTATLLGAVVLLLAYFGFRAAADAGDADGSVKLRALEAEPVRLDVRSPKVSVTLVRRDGIWTLQPSGWRADPAKVKKIKDWAAEARTLELVSLNGYPAKYELDDEKGVDVRLETRRGSRAFRVGKMAPTFRHSFVRHGEDGRIFQTAGTIQSDLPTDLNGWRDPSVLALNASEVTRLGWAVGTRRSEWALTSNAPTAWTLSNQGATVWKNADGKAAPAAFMDDVLANLSRLEAGGFPTNDVRVADLASKKVRSQILIQTRAGDASLTIYDEGPAKDKFYAVSSARADVFWLAADAVARLDEPKAP